MKYIKRTKPLLLAEVRYDMLQNEVGVSVDYYPAKGTATKHCAWVCTDANCPRCGDSFKSYPAFVNHLRIHHNIQFSEIKAELLMRQRYHNIQDVNQ